MKEVISSKKESALGLSAEIAKNLVLKSTQPTYYKDKLEKAIEISLDQNSPLRMRMVLCPNWNVNENGRAIERIPVSVNNNHLLIDDDSQKIIGLLSEEVPNLVKYLNRNDVDVQLLVILADILSPGWVNDSKKAKENLEQNRKAMKLLLFSSENGKEVFNHERASVKVQSQLQLATNTPKYQERLIGYQIEALKTGTTENLWYLEVIGKLQEIGEYEDKRNDLAGLRKIWERALFLSSIYALDGEVVESDFNISGFAPSKYTNYVALGTVGTPHADIMAQGLNIKRKTPLPTITPFNNTMEHSWKEKRVSSIVY